MRICGGRDVSNREDEKRTLKKVSPQLGGYEERVLAIDKLVFGWFREGNFDGRVVLDEGGGR